MYTGTSDDIITHVTLCAFRTLPDEGIDNKKQVINSICVSVNFVLRETYSNYLY